jgi:UDPglucose 6-dehydrogenase
MDRFRVHRRADPADADGSVDLSFIEKSRAKIAGVLTHIGSLLKSTVPVKTGEKVAETIKRYKQARGRIRCVSNRSSSGKVARSLT